MANLRLSREIHTNAQNSINFSSEYAGNVAENVLVAPTSLKWISTTDTSEWISGDWGQQKTVSFISLLGVDFSQGGTVTIRARLSTVSNFSTTTYDTTLASTDVHGDSALFPLFVNFWISSPVTARYWRIDITDAANTDGRLEIGRVLIGRHFSPTVNMDLGYSLGFVDRSPISYTAGNILKLLQRPKNRLASCTLSHLTQDELVIVNKMVVGHEVFVSAYPEIADGGTADDAEQEQQNTIVGVVQSNVAVRQLSGMRHGTQITIREDGAVGSIPGDSMSAVWLRVDNNLSDLDDAGTARDNLAIGDDIGRPNMLDNAGMQFWQRSESVGALTTSGVKAADRWYIDFTQSASESYSVVKSDVEDLGEEDYGLIQPIRLGTTAAHGGIALTQRLEEQWLDAVSSKTVALSFWFKAAAAVTLDDIKLAGDLDNAGTGDFSSAFTPSTVSWSSGGLVRYEGTVTLAAISTTRGTDPYLELRIGSTSSQSAQWQTVEIAGIKLEIGDVATRWQAKDPGTDYENCRRHYQASSSTGAENIFSGDVTNTDAYYQPVMLATEMYATPTIAVTNQAATNFPTTASSAASISTKGFWLTRTANGSGAGLFRDSWTAKTDW